MIGSNKPLNNTESLRVAGFIMFCLAALLLCTRSKSIWGLLLPLSSFKTTSGVITHSQLRQGIGRNAGWRFNIRYRYEVNRIVYFCNVVRFDRKNGEYKFSNSYVSKYPTGKRVIVYFLPQEPSFAVLEPEHKQQGLISLVTTVTVFLLSFFAILKSYRPKHTNSAQK